MDHFRSACFMASVLGDEIHPSGLLSELTIKNFLKCCAVHGGKTFRVPTVDEVMEGWETGRKVGNNQKLHTLWVTKQNGGSIQRQQLLDAIKEVLEEFPEDHHVKVSGMILAMFTENQLYSK